MSVDKDRSQRQQQQHQCLVFDVAIKLVRTTRTIKNLKHQLIIKKSTNLILLLYTYILLATTATTTTQLTSQRNVITNNLMDNRIRYPINNNYYNNPSQQYPIMLSLITDHYGSAPLEFSEQPSIVYNRDKQNDNYKLRKREDQANEGAQKDERQLDSEDIELLDKFYQDTRDNDPFLDKGVSFEDLWRDLRLEELTRIQALLDVQPVVNDYNYPHHHHPQQQQQSHNDHIPQDMKYEHPTNHKNHNYNNDHQNEPIKEGINEYNNNNMMHHHQNPISSNKNNDDNKNNNQSPKSNDWSIDSSIESALGDELSRLEKELEDQLLHHQNQHQQQEQQHEQEHEQNEEANKESEPPFEPTDDQIKSNVNGNERFSSSQASYSPTIKLLTNYDPLSGLASSHETNNNNNDNDKSPIKDNSNDQNINKPTIISSTSTRTTINQEPNINQNKQILTNGQQRIVGATLFAQGKLNEALLKPKVSSKLALDAIKLHDAMFLNEPPKKDGLVRVRMYYHRAIHDDKRLYGNGPWKYWAHGWGLEFGYDPRKQQASEAGGGGGGAEAPNSYQRGYTIERAYGRDFCSSSQNYQDQNSPSSSPPKQGQAQLSLSSKLQPPPFKCRQSDPNFFNQFHDAGKYSVQNRNYLTTGDYK